MRCAHSQSAHRHWQDSSYFLVSLTLPNDGFVRGSGLSAFREWSAKAAVHSCPPQPAEVTVLPLFRLIFTDS